MGHSAAHVAVTLSCTTGSTVTPQHAKYETTATPKEPHQCAANRVTPRGQNRSSARTENRDFYRPLIIHEVRD